MSGCVVVLGGIFLIASCSPRGRQAEKLDRETALSLLRESGGAALPAPTCEMDLVVYETGPAEAARLKFLKSLEPALVKLTSTSDAEPPWVHRDAVVAREAQARQALRVRAGGCEGRRDAAAQRHDDEDGRLPGG